MAFKTMSADQYIAERLDQFQGWYDAKAVRAKADFRRIRVLAVVGAAIVPVVTNVLPQAYGIDRYVTTAVSLAVSIAVALDSVYHFGEQWKNYRSTEQFLSREKFLFRTGEGPYKQLDAEAAFVLLVERCESQIAAENSATLNVISTAAQQADSASAAGPLLSNRQDN
jgi:hypothetical protein